MKNEMLTKHDLKDIENMLKALIFIIIFYGSLLFVAHLL